MPEFSVQQQLSCIISVSVSSGSLLKVLELVWSTSLRSSLLLRPCAPLSPSDHASWIEQLINLDIEKVGTQVIDHLIVTN